MNKDFPSYLFPNIIKTGEECIDKFKGLNLNASPDDFYKFVDNIVKQDYKYPIFIDCEDDEEVNDNDSNVKCFTHKFNSSNQISAVSPVLPWTLTNPIEDEFGLKLFNVKAYYENAYTKEHKCNCRSTEARFFPSLFARGIKGRCIMADGIWMTPIEFQQYSGSTWSNWKEVIKIHCYIETNNPKWKNRKDVYSLKDFLIKNNLNVHSDQCNCALCLNNEFMQSSNVDVFNTFFINKNKDLITIYPDKSKEATSALIEVCYFTNDLRHRPDASMTNVLANMNIRNYTNKLQKFQLDLNHQLTIKKIDTKVYDEDGYFDSRNRLSNNIEEIYLGINLGDTICQMIKLELRNESVLNMRKQVLYEINFRKNSIKSLAASNMIKGECAVLSEGNIYLLNVKNSNKHANNQSFSSNDYLKIASELQPTFKLNKPNYWQNVFYGSQPREFLYSDYSQILSIDSRIKRPALNFTKDIFKTYNRNLDQNEIIYRTDVVKNDFNTYLACCTNTFLVIDSRYPSRPLISWKHHLKSPPVFLNNTFLSDMEGSTPHSTNIAVISDSTDSYIYQFSTKLNDVPMGHNYPLKIDSPSEIVKYSDLNYDKQLKRCMDYRLNQNILGLSTLTFQSSFALFQIQMSHDIYYQCFEPVNQEQEVQYKEIQKKIYDKWLEDLSSKTLDNSYSKQINEDEIDEDTELYSCELLEDLAGKPNKYCDICSSKSRIKSENYLSIKTTDDLECQRCGNQVFENDQLERELISNNLSKVLNLVDFNPAVIEKSDFTKSLYSIWSEEELSYSDNSNTGFKSSPDSKFHFGVEPKRRKRIFDCKKY